LIGFIACKWKGSAFGVAMALESKANADRRARDDDGACEAIL
jgi:hypothetical protein